MVSRITADVDQVKYFRFTIRKKTACIANVPQWYVPEENNRSSLAAHRSGVVSARELYCPVMDSAFWKGVSGFASRVTRGG